VSVVGKILYAGQKHFAKLKPKPGLTYNFVPQPEKTFGLQRSFFRNVRLSRASKTINVALQLQTT